MPNFYEVKDMLKAANYGARAGQTIAGALGRGGNGKFVRVGSGTAATGPKKPRTPKAQAAAQAANEKLAAEQEAAQNDVNAQAQQEAQQLRGDTLDGLFKGMDDGLTEAVTNMIDSPQDGLNPEYTKKLSDLGLLAVNSKGQSYLTGAGSAMARYAAKGDAVRAQAAFDRAQAQAQRKAAILARKVAPKKRRGRKEVLTTAQRNDLKSNQFVFPDEVLFPITEPAGVMQAVHGWGRYKGKHSFDEFKAGVIRRARAIGAMSEVPPDWVNPGNKKEISPVMVFKQKDGRFRWLTISSNPYKDRDRQYITWASLAKDVERADQTKDYGDLLWWHEKQIKLGTCDYNALFGKFLVESGTFKTERIGEQVSKLKNLGVSIGFKHKIYDPDPSGAFHTTRRFERSLLPHDRASNLFTRLRVVTSTKESKRMLYGKVKELIDKMGNTPEAQAALKEMLGDIATLETIAQAAGVDFKEVKAAGPGAGAVDPEEAAPGDAQEDLAAGDNMIMDMSAKELGEALEPNLTSAVVAGLTQFVAQQKAGAAPAPAPGPAAAQPPAAQAPGPMQMGQKDFTDWALHNPSAQAVDYSKLAEAIAPVVKAQIEAIVSPTLKEASEGLTALKAEFATVKTKVEELASDVPAGVRASQNLANQPGVAPGTQHLKNAQPQPDPIDNILAQLGIPLSVKAG